MEEVALRVSTARWGQEMALMKRTTGDDVAESSRIDAERKLKEQEWMPRLS